MKNHLILKIVISHDELIKTITNILDMNIRILQFTLMIPQIESICFKFVQSKDSTIILRYVQMYLYYFHLSFDQKLVVLEYIFQFEKLSQ